MSATDAIHYSQQGDTVLRDADRLPTTSGRAPTSMAGSPPAIWRRMYGGVSAELLWKPVDSRLALGVEVELRQAARLRRRLRVPRLLGRRPAMSRPTTTSTAAITAAMHAGRYLAGDWGATLELTATFANGWKVGAFATFTDVSFADFGEGSFDKGIRIEIPLSFLLGQPDPLDAGHRRIRPVTRDGGQRLNVDGRLYDSIRDYHGTEPVAANGECSGDEASAAPPASRSWPRLLLAACGSSNDGPSRLCPAEGTSCTAAGPGPCRRGARPARAGDRAQEYFATHPRGAGRHRPAGRPGRGPDRRWHGDLVFDRANGPYRTYASADRRPSPAARACCRPAAA